MTTTSVVRAYYSPPFIMGIPDLQETTLDLTATMVKSKPEFMKIKDPIINYGYKDKSPQHFL